MKRLLGLATTLLIPAAHQDKDPESAEAASDLEANALVCASNQGDGRMLWRPFQTLQFFAAFGALTTLYPTTRIQLSYD